MKKLILLLCLISNIALAQGNYYLHNNASSITILPSQITTRHSSGNFNTSLGRDALRATTRDSNTAVGYRALYNNALAPTMANHGTNNTGIGMNALYTNTNGYNNVSIGHNSLYSNTVGNWNIALGNNALYENVGGYTNIAIGFECVNKATSANYNTAVGTYSMRYLTGGFNTALGGNALSGSAFSTSNGTLNVAIGYGASQSNTSGANNVSLGANALYSNISGIGNVAIGYNAGYSETGSNRLYIDNSSTSSPLIGGNFSSGKVGINRSMTNLNASAENFQVQGTGLFTGNLCAASYNCVSDLRYKKNITPLKSSLTNVLGLRGVNYDWRIQEFPEQAFNTQRQTGFIAQELEQVYPEMVTTDANGFKSVDYARLTPVLVEAIKELNEKIVELEKGNDALKSENTQMKKQTDAFEARLQSLEKERLK